MDKKRRKRRPARKGLARRRTGKAAVARSSVFVKIVLCVAAVYLFFVSIYIIARALGLLSMLDLATGKYFDWFLWGAQILIVSITSTVAIKIFLFRPVDKVKSVIGKVGRGVFSSKIDIKTNDEFGELAACLNNMIDELRQFHSHKKMVETDLIHARKELKLKESLEKKGNAIKAANKRLESLVKNFTLLYEIGQRINSTMETAELYRTLLESLPSRLKLQKFAILIVDEKGEFLSVEAAYGFGNTERIYDLAFRIGEGISGEVAKKGELIYLPDVVSDKRFLHYRGESVEEGSFLSIPLRFKNDILGVMNCSRPDKNAFSEEDIRLLVLVANQIALAVENAKLYTKTRELSVRDELTGLYNRRHFQDVMHMEWKRATRFARPMSLLMIDIDRFKEFNDTFGHLHGDKVLKLISTILAKNLREVDTLARFGGEEFVILLPDTDREGAVVVGEKLRRLVQTERFEEDRRRILPLTISVGISAFPEDAKEMDDLIDHADVALYDAKDGGRNRVVVYASSEELSGGLARPGVTT